MAATTAVSSGGSPATIEKRRQRALVLLEEARQLGAIPTSSFDGGGLRDGAGNGRRSDVHREPSDASSPNAMRRTKSMTLPRSISKGSQMMETTSLRRKREEKERERDHRNLRRSVTLTDTLPPITPPGRHNGSKQRPSPRSRGDLESSPSKHESRRSLMEIAGSLPHGPLTSPIRRQYDVEDVITEPNGPEVDAWLQSTLASVPCKRKTSLLMPLVNSSETGESPSAQPEGNPPTNQATGTAEEQDKTKTDGAANEDQQKKMAAVVDPNAVPDVAEVARRLAEGFSAGDLTRMRSTFNRFKVPDTMEVHKDDLLAIMERLGYMMVEEEKLRQIADDVTIYSTLDFSEFVSLAERFMKWEQSKFKEIFDSYDADGGGQLNVEELERLMSSLGFTPLRKMVREALDVVDKDKSGSLNFEEFVQMLAIYRSTEGFTRDEVAEIRGIFMRESAEAPQLPAKKLSDVLLRFYGPSSMDKCKKLGAEVMTGSRKDAEEGDQGPPSDLHIPEALIWSRRLREMEISRYREEFDKQDKDKSGAIDAKELQQCIQEIGFTLTLKNIQDIMDEVDEDSAKPNGDPCTKDGKLDFDEFVNLMMVFRTTDGFTKAEMTELQNTFDRFDDSGDAEIDVMELSDMLRYMGYMTKLDDVHRLIAKVDFNQSGSLDFREFVRLMRLHREYDMQAARKVFDKLMDDKEGAMPGFAVSAALQELGFDKPATGSSSTARRGSATDPRNPPDTAFLDFDGLVSVVDRHRKVRVAEGRRRAGFSTQEIDKFRRLFSSYDSDQSGLIDAKEIVALLTDLGHKMTTKEERDNVLEQLDKARTSASQVGVEDVGESGGSVSFWVMVQLLRVLYNRDDKRVLDREAHAAEQSRFSTAEIEEFREVFMRWWSRDKVFEDDVAANMPGGAAPDENEAEPDVKELSKDGMRRLLRSLGMQLTSDQRQDLEKKIAELGTPNGKVDFATFLRLMRWMLDTDFADMNRATSKASR